MQEQMCFNQTLMLGRLSGDMSASAWQHHTLSLQDVNSMQYLGIDGDKFAMRDEESTDCRWKFDLTPRRSSVTNIHALRHVSSWKFFAYTGDDGGISGADSLTAISSTWGTQLVWQEIDQSYVVLQNGLYLRVDPSTGALTGPSTRADATRFHARSIPTYIGTISQAGAAAGARSEGMQMDRAAVSPFSPTGLDLGDVLDPGQGNYSVAFWMKAAEGSRDQWLASKGNFETDVKGWSIRLHKHALQFRTSHGSHSSDKINIESSIHIQEEVFYHVAMVINRPGGSPGTVSAYVNGELAGTHLMQVKHGPDTSNTSYNIMGWHAAPLLVGQKMNGDANLNLPRTKTFSGVIDDFAIWTDAISVADVQSLYSQYNQKSSFYRFTTGGTPAVNQLVKQVSGVATIMAQAPSTVSAGEWHILELAASGNNITAHVDGVRVFTVLDTGDTLPTGYLGLFSWSVTNSYVPGSTVFDDVSTRAPVSSFIEETSFAVSAIVSGAAT